jgi:hypothetical protein
MAIGEVHKSQGSGVMTVEPKGLALDIWSQRRGKPLGQPFGYRLLVVKFNFCSRSPPGNITISDCSDLYIAEFKVTKMLE